MSISPCNIRPLTDFIRHAQALIAALKTSGDPIVLTVKGKAEVVVQDAEAYQDLVDRLERSEQLWTLQSLYESSRQGRDISLDEMKAKIWALLAAQGHPYRPAPTGKRKQVLLAKPEKHL